MAAHHEGFADLYLGLVARLDQIPDFAGIEANGFLAEHVLPRFGATDRPRHVQVIRQGIVDGVDVRIGQQRFVGAIGFRNPQFCGGLPSFRFVARRDRSNLAELSLLHRRDHSLDGNLGDAQYAPADSGHLLWPGRMALQNSVQGDGFMLRSKPRAQPYSG